MNRWTWNSWRWRWAWRWCRWFGHRRRYEECPTIYRRRRGPNRGELVRGSEMRPYCARCGVGGDEAYEWGRIRTGWEERRFRWHVRLLVWHDRLNPHLAEERARAIEDRKRLDAAGGSVEQVPF